MWTQFYRDVIAVQYSLSQEVPKRSSILFFAFSTRDFQMVLYFIFGDLVLALHFKERIDRIQAL